MKANDSPIVFKILIEATVDILNSKRDRLTEEFVLKNFLSLFDQHQDLPLGLLVDPVIQVFSDRLRGQRNKN